jgi:hypothetical protein
MKQPQPYPMAALAIRIAPLFVSAAPKIAEFLGWNRDTPDTFLGISNWIWLGFGGIWLLGALLADVSNPASYLNHWIRWRRRLFIVDDVRRWEIIDGNPSLVMDVRFTRALSDSTLLLRVYTNLRHGVAMNHDAIVLKRGVSFAKDETLKIVVASFLEATTGLQVGRWAPQADAPLLIGADYRNLVEVEVQTGGRSSGYKMFVANMNWDIRSGRNFFFLTEDEDILSDPQ